MNGFFIISGFLIAQSWFRSPEPFNFFKKRFLRIYPALIAALAFCVFIVGPLGGADLHSYFSQSETYRFFLPLFLGPYGGLPRVFENAPWIGMVNGSIWTIRFEIFCYFLLAAMGMLGMLRHPRIVLVFLAISLLAAFAETSAFPYPWKLILPYFGDIPELPRFISYFLSGVVFYLFREEIRCSVTLFLIACAGAAAVYLSPVQTLLLPIFIAYIVLYFAFSPRIPLQNFGVRGDFSYGIYLYAFPVQQLLIRYAPAAHQPLILTVLAFPITLLLAMLSWHFIERPFLQFKRNVTLAHPATEISYSTDTVIAAVRVQS